MVENRDRAPGRPARMLSLDLLRAVAIFLVIVRHFHPDDASWFGFSPVIEALRRGGWIGVDLFFVLSGFLVSGLLFTEYQRRASVDVGRFLIRRGLKIYPPFYAFLAIHAVQVVFRHGRGSLDLAALLCEALFVPNYGPNLHQHTWSLAVEEHFYLLVAALVYGLVRLARRRADPFRAIPWMYVSVALLCLVARIITARLSQFGYRTSLGPTHLRIDSLTCGLCLSYLFHFQRQRFVAIVRGRERVFAIAGMALLLPAFMFPIEQTPWIYTVGYLLFAIGSALVVAALVVGGVGRTLFVRAAARVGEYSYSIYLWHIAVLTALEVALPAHGRSAGSPLALVAYTAGSLVLGIGMARLTEIPVLRLRDRMFPQRSGVLVGEGCRRSSAAAQPVASAELL